MSKAAIVTGGSRGIGAATCVELAKNGYYVVVCYNTSKDKAEEVLANVKKYSNGIIVKVDVAKENEIIDMIDTAIGAYGRIDVLINNAATVYDRPFEESTTEEWDDTYRVNLRGTYLCSKYAAEHLKKNRGSSIINISSTNGINTLYTWSMDYDATKAAIINLTMNLAKELAPNVRVNAVAPGWVNTDMNKDLPQEVIEEETEKILLGRFAEPVDIAETVVFLTSDKAKYITGEVIKVDGGISIH